MKKLVHLSEAEFIVMKILWSNTPPITTNVIMAQLPPDRPWKLQTLTSILVRLAGKNFVTSEKNGKERLYFPCINEEDYLSYETKHFMKKYYNNSLNSFFNFLYKKDSIHIDDIKELYKKLDE